MTRQSVQHPSGVLSFPFVLADASFCMSKVHDSRRLRSKVGEVAWAVFLSDGYVTSGGCMFNLFDGSRQRGEFSRRPPLPFATPSVPAAPPRPSPSRRSPTQANVNYRRLWIIFRRSQTTPAVFLSFDIAHLSSPLPPPAALSFSTLSFLPLSLRPLSPRSTFLSFLHPPFILVYPPQTYVRWRTLSEKGRQLA